jgi:hypothetical protein
MTGAGVSARLGIVALGAATPKVTEAVDPPTVYVTAKDALGELGLKLLSGTQKKDTGFDVRLTGVGSLFWPVASHC